VLFVAVVVELEVAVGVRVEVEVLLPAVELWVEPPHPARPRVRAAPRASETGS
jgi:hypothetical protein